MLWTTEQKIFTVEAYFWQKSIHAAQLQFKERFRCCEFPVHSTIYRWVKVNKFRIHGTVHNLSCKDTNRQLHSGLPKSSRTPHKVAAVRDSVVHSPSKSVRQRSQELGINRESVWRILIADLHMYPCRIQIKQKLTPDDMRKRVIMFQWFCNKIDAVPDFLDNLWFSDKAHFLLSGHVNSKNNIFWGSTPPDHCLQRPLHSVKCTAWVARHHWTILVQGRQRPVCGNQHWAICPGAWQVLDSTWSTERGRQGPPVVPAGWCHPQNLKRTIGMGTAPFSWPTDQPQVWPAVVAAFTGLEPPDFYMWDTLRTGCMATTPRLSLTWRQQSQQQ